MRGKLLGTIRQPGSGGHPHPILPEILDGLQGDRFFLDLSELLHGPYGKDFVGRKMETAIFLEKTIQGRKYLMKSHFSGCDSFQDRLYLGPFRISG